jgi:branched-subunit amino acid ABC-type transport system permease component
MQTAALILFGGMPLGVPQILNGQFKLGSASVPNNNIPIIVGGFLMIALLFLFVQKTKLGLAIRALQQDQDAAALQGINIASTRIVIWVPAAWRPSPGFYWPRPLMLLPGWAAATC